MILILSGIREALISLVRHHPTPHGCLLVLFGVLEGGEAGLHGPRALLRDGVRPHRHHPLGKLQSDTNSSILFYILPLTQVQGLLIINLQLKIPFLDAKRPPRLPRRGQQPRDRQRQQPQSFFCVLRAEPLLRVHDQHVRLRKCANGQAEHLKQREMVTTRCVLLFQLRVEELQNYRVEV